VRSGEVRRFSLRARPGRDSDDLKQVELEIFGLGNAPENGVIGRLSAPLDLPQGHPRVRGRLPEHTAEQLVGHEMGTGAGGQIAAARQQLHGLEIDLLIAAVGRLDGGVAFGESKNSGGNQPQTTPQNTYQPQKTYKATQQTLDNFNSNYNIGDLSGFEVLSDGEPPF